jgi:hypothetical protein
VCAAEFFRQLPNFSGNLAENIWPELATLSTWSGASKANSLGRSPALGISSHGGQAASEINKIY